MLQAADIAFPFHSTPKYCSFIMLSFPKPSHAVLCKDGSSRSLLVHVDGCLLDGDASAFRSSGFGDDDAQDTVLEGSLHSFLIDP